MATSITLGGAVSSVRSLLSLHSLTVLATLVGTISAQATGSYTYSYSNVAVTGGGYITGIVAHPTEPDLTYARTDVGGAYRWAATEQRWVALNDFIGAEEMDLTGTESLALDPNNPDMLYLAQGRYAVTSTPIAAMLVSSDRGATFKNFSTPFNMGANDMGRGNGERLAVNPFVAGEVWMGTRQAGLWKSSDSAATWTNITSVPDAFANNMGIYFVIFDPTTEGTVYIGGSTPGGLYRTKDSGETWEALPGQPTTWEKATLVAGFTPLSTGPQPMRAQLGSNGVLYVTYGDGPGPWGVTYGEVHKFDTTTSAWTSITPGKANNTTPAPFTPQTGAPGAFCGISVDLADPNTLVVATLSRDPGPSIDTIYLSRDGGASWTDIAQLTSPAGAVEHGYWSHSLDSAALPDGITVPWLGFDYGERWRKLGAPDDVIGSPRFGWWMSALLLDPSAPGRLMVGTGATIWAADDLFDSAAASASPAWHVRAGGIEQTVVLSMMSPPSGPANLYSGWGDISGHRHDDLGAPQPLFTGPVFSNTHSLDFAGQNHSVLTRSGSNNVEYKDGGCGQGAYSLDAGDNWQRFANCAPGVNVNVTGFTAAAVDASGRHVVWATGLGAQPASPSGNSSGNGPWASADFGASWTSPSGDLVVQATKIAADRVQEATFYACDNNTVYLSEDGGLSWAAKATGLPSCATPVVNFAVAGELWLPVWTDGLLHSVDFGATWAPVGPAGVDARHFSVGAGAGPEGPVTLFLWGKAGEGAASGLYRSDDQGASWVRINDETHQYGGIQGILGDSREYGRVYVGTNGRGIVYADVVDDKGGVVPGTKGI